MCIDWVFQLWCEGSAFPSVTEVLNSDLREMPPPALAFTLVQSCSSTVQAGKSEAPILAHNRPVYDISFGTDSVIATCSADGTARIVDVRCVVHTD
jgi:WD40 repeat protein